MFITVFSPFSDINGIICSKISNIATFAKYHPSDFFLFIFTTETQIDQLSCRQCATSFRTERTFSIKRIVYIDDPALVMSAYRNSATQMGNNQVHVFVIPANLFCMEVRSSFLI